MRILQVNTRDGRGGAEKVSFDLMTLYRKKGHQSWLAVGQRFTRDPNVILIPNDKLRSRQARRWLAFARILAPAAFVSQRWSSVLQNWLIFQGQPQRRVEINGGYEDFDFPATSHLFELPPEFPEVLHLHNLHGSYFDLRCLPMLSNKIPTFLTLHDAWLTTGHCAHSLSCERWLHGCGECPDLRLYPPIAIDQTVYNWTRKADIYKKCRIRVATPCDWLMARVEHSILWPAVVDARVIPYGIDLEVFNPINRQTARTELGIPASKIVLLFVAHGIRRNIWKDYDTLRQAVRLVATNYSGEEVILFVIGDEGDQETIDRAKIRFIPQTEDPRVIASYQQAADIYIHAARQDTFPLVILEALACGTPVIATGVGGIPEQVQDGVSGYITPPGDPSSMAQAIMRLLMDPNLRRSMGVQAAAYAREHFDSIRQADEYLAWYQQALN